MIVQAALITLFAFFTIFSYNAFRKSKTVSMIWRFKNWQYLLFIFIMFFVTGIFGILTVYYAIQFFQTLFV